MTIETMFPPRAESVDSFSAQPAIGQRETGERTSESRKPAESLSRRAALAGIAMLPAILPAAAAEKDPIFAAIEEHKKAKAAFNAALAEVERLTKIADAEVGPRRIMVLNMARPGPFKEFVEVTCWIDIDRLVPAESYPDENAHYREKLRQQQEEHDAITGDTDKITLDPCAGLWAAIDGFAETVPTTMAGLFAMILYAAEIEEEEADAFRDYGQLIANMATSARALVGGQS